MPHNTYILITKLLSAVAYPLYGVVKHLAIRDFVDGKITCMWFRVSSQLSGKTNTLTTIKQHIMARTRRLSSSYLLLSFLVVLIGCSYQAYGYDIRLVNGSTSYSGRVEVRTNSNSTWLSLCGAYWTSATASVACRQLGFFNATESTQTAVYGSGLGRIVSVNFQCVGTEARLDDCPTASASEGDCQHSADPGVVCFYGAPQGTTTTTIPPTTVAPTTIPPNKRVRLVGGNSPFQGRVEVYLNNQWGTICDDSWDTTDANVVCRQLGFSKVYAATTNARFGQGTGPIQMDDTRCYGSESSILDCTHRGIGIHNCRHSEDAGVICLPDTRLAGGRNSSEGRVEIRLGDVWGTLCGVGFDPDIDADILCGQLGFGPAITVTKGDSRFGTTDDPVLIKNLFCNTNLQMIYQCASQRVSPDDSECGHDQDVALTCSTADLGNGLRLVGGSNVFEGRVEVSINNTWGTVCDDYWDLVDAQVVCRQLGLGKAVEARRYASFGRGFGPIHMDDVKCTGSEANLLDCEYNNNTACSHSEDAGVVCAPKIRLVGGRNAYQGRVEMFVNNEWGTVCDRDWESEEARVTCRQLDYGFAATATQSAKFGEGSGPILADTLGCSGYEGSLVQCTRFSISVNTSCDHSRDAGVICSLPENNITLRLSDGQSAYEGRIEIELDDVWGTICDNNWDKQDARVICRQLGLGPGIEAPRNSSFGPGSGPIYVDNLDCRGHESTISLCPNNGVEVHNCTHDNDASVVCSAPIRLVDGTNPFEGRVEVLKGHVWGTVCDDGWDMNDANVVCRELGFGPAKRAVPASYFGSRSYGSIHFDEVQCTGSESMLMDCPHKTTHDCSHLEDAGVVCAGKDMACDIPSLPQNTYMSIIKASYRENDVIGVICKNGNSSVEWRCGQDKMWAGPPIQCYDADEEMDGPNTALVIGVVAIIIGLALVTLVVIVLVVFYRNQKRQNFRGAITMSDVLAHIDTIKNATPTGNGRADVKLEGHTVAMPESDIAVAEDPFSHDPAPFIEGKDSKSASTGAYARLIE